MRISDRSSDVGSSDLRVIAFAESELPKAAVNPTGVGQTHPDGAAYYAYQLKRNTSTDMTAEQVHELGLSEVKRLRGELEKVQAQIGFEGDLQAFFKHMQDDPARLFPTPTPAARPTSTRRRRRSTTSSSTCPSTSACCPRRTGWSSAWKRSASRTAPRSITTRPRPMARDRASTTRTCRT